MPILKQSDKPPGWQNSDEQKFHEWYAQAIKNRNLNHNPDDPLQHYNYRYAFKAGAWPDAEGHWPSEFKDSTHPNRFVNGQDTILTSQQPEERVASKGVQAMPGKMSQSDFIAALKKELPELSDLSDNTIMSQVFKRKPELRSQIETPDDQAAVAQAKAEARSKSIVDPETWQKHPKIAEFSRQVLNAAPGVGSIVGGLALSPETFGAGIIPGMALGGGAGRGLRDIATSMLGLEKQKSPLEAASNIGMDTGLAAITPGAMEAIGSPIQTARELTGDLLKFSPRGLHRYTVPQILEEFAAGGKKPNIIPPAEFSRFKDIPTDSGVSDMPKQGSRFTPNQFGMTADTLTSGKNVKLSSNPIIDLIDKNPKITKQHLEEAIKMIMERDSSLTAPRSFRSPSFK